MTEEIHKEFMQELSELLKKYKAEMNMEEIRRTWAGSEDSMVVTFEAIYDGEKQRPWSQLQLPRFID